MTISKEELEEVYNMLKDRIIHPPGHFDKGGRFWLKDSDLVNVRTPSRAYPYSHMIAGRTLKFVKSMAIKYKCKNKEELLKFLGETSGKNC